MKQMRGVEFALVTFCVTVLLVTGFTLLVVSMFSLNSGPDVELFIRSNF